MTRTIITLGKAGSNPDQAPVAFIHKDGDDVAPLDIGDIFHIEGQPADVKWRVEKIETVMIDTVRS